MSVTYRRYRPVAGTVLSCEVHGPLRRRENGWACPGWDGEGCLNITYLVPDSAAARLLSGQTYWPGVLVT